MRRLSRMVWFLALGLGCGDDGFVIALDGGQADLGANDASVPGDSDGGVDPAEDAGPPRDLGPGPGDGGPPVDARTPVDAFRGEVCDNGTDDDSDGDADCWDSDCASRSHCQSVPAESCTNLMDDDGDGAQDCDDGDCAGVTDCGSISEASLGCYDFCVFEPEDQLARCHLACLHDLGIEGSRETRCHDGLDNDDDELSDCEDADCRTAAGC